MSDPSITQARARRAGLLRRRPPNDPLVVRSARDLAAANLESFIRRTVDAAPPLTAEQRDKLATLLRAPSSGGAS